MEQPFSVQLRKKEEALELVKRHSWDYAGSFTVDAPFSVPMCEMRYWFTTGNGEMHV